MEDFLSCSFIIKITLIGPNITVQIGYINKLHHMLFAIINNCFAKFWLNI